MSSPKTISILGYDIFTGRKEFFADGVKGVVCTLNPHSYILARNDSLFSEALKSSDWLIPDGVGIKLAARLLCGERIEKIAGSDLHETIINSLDRIGGSCFYLGSSEETLLMIREKNKKRMPALRTGIYSPQYKEIFSEEESGEMIEVVNRFSPDVLFVGMTAPKQEKWVFENRTKLNVPLICSVGAVFDFYAGTVKRSGRFWIKLGLEWLPRLLREPRRLWKRNFVSTPLFLWFLIIEKGKCLLSYRREKK